MAENWQPTVSVIIPTLNAGAGFPLLLESLKKQKTRLCEIVVVDSESVDETCAVANAYGCRVMAIKRKDFDHGGTRNLAIRSTTADVVVLLTQDAIPADERTIEELIGPLVDKNVAIAYGRQLPCDEAGRLERFARQYNYPPTSLVKDKGSIQAMGLRAFFCSDSCSAMRRDMFERLGGLPEGGVVNEDMLFAAMAIVDGMKVCYAAEACVVHSHAFTAAGLWRRYYRTGQFFADNEWLVRLAGPGSYGRDMLRAGMTAFWKERAFGGMAALLLESMAKVVAVKAGWHCRRLHKGSKRSEDPLKQSL